MITVIDVGCARYGGDYSIERLIDMFHPELLYGFDPAWDRRTMAKWPIGTGTKVVVFSAAAWIEDGEVRFLKDGLNGQVGDTEHWPYVPCVDLARFIDEIDEPGDAGEVVLKLDAEGSEIELLEHLIRTKVDLRLSRVVVEWHPWNDPKRRRAIERALTCPVEQWRW